jgi:hypothetical protein
VVLRAAVGREPITKFQLIRLVSVTNVAPSRIQFPNFEPYPVTLMTCIHMSDLFHKSLETISISYLHEIPLPHTSWNVVILFQEPYFASDLL